MQYEWMNLPQVTEIFDEAAYFARNDNSSRISEWHIMLSLLRFNSVWDRFSRHREFKERLFAEAARHSDGKGTPEGDAPHFPPRRLQKLCDEAERLRRRVNAALPLPHHFLFALLAVGTDPLGCEPAHPDGDDDGQGLIFGFGGLDYQVAVAVEDIVDMLVLVDVAVHGLGLRVELVGELTGLYGLEAGVIVNSLLGIEGDELSSYLSRIEDEGVHHLGSRIDPGCEATGTRAYYDDIVQHWAGKRMLV